MNTSALNITFSTLTTKPYEPSWISIAVNITGALIFTIGVPVNIIIITLVLRRRSLRNPTNYFVSSLAIADLFVLLWMLVWMIGIHYFPSTRTIYQYVYPSIDLFLAVATMFNVACVSLDRAIAVVQPLTYESIVTKKRSLAVIGVVWMTSLSILILAFLRIVFEDEIYNRFVIYTGFVSYFIPVLVIITSYSIILLIVVQQVKGVEKVMYSAQLAFDPKSIETRNRNRRKLLRELKITGNILLIVVPFTVGWTFFVGTHMYELVQREQVKDIGHNFVLIIIPWILSGLDPVLYLLLTRPLRRSFTDTWRKLLKKDRLSIDESRSSLFVYFSRRASNVFRRASSSVIDDGSTLMPGSRNPSCRRKSSAYSYASDKVTPIAESYEESTLIQFTTVV